MKLNEYMPPFLKNVREFNEIFNSEDFEIDEIKNQIDKMLTEVIVKTADSYGLERYEKIYKVTNVSKTLEARRMTILLKMNNRTQYTYKWLANTLNEAIGEENYNITTDFDNYKISIEILLSYTEAAEILKRDLVKQIPANIELNYRLISNMEQNTGIVLSQQSYIHLITNMDTITEPETINQYNNVGVNVSAQEFIKIKECEI